MDVAGPRAISSLNSLSRPEVTLRPFQRVAAHVLDVTGTTALLSIEGVPVVAQLTSAEQVTDLLTRQTAQFIITQLSNQKITLKMIKGDSPEAKLIASSPAGRELAVRLLEQNNIPVTVNHLMMARSVLKQHLPITNDLLNELMEALSEYGSWGNKEADVAVTLIAARLPISAQSIALASRQPANISDSISELIKALNDIASPDLPPAILKQLELNMWLLNGLVLDGDEEPSRLTEQLKAVVELLGRSLENSLLEQSQSLELTSPETSLFSLARLQKVVEQLGKNETAESIRKFLEDIRLNQFSNAKPEWVEINLPIQNAKTGADFSTVRLRIARDPNASSRKIDATSTRLILQLGINSNETVEVDLSIRGKQVRSSVIAPDPQWCQQAEKELPSLEEALQSLGFTLQDSRISTCEAEPLAVLNISSDDECLMAVDIEV